LWTAYLAFLHLKSYILPLLIIALAHLQLLLPQSIAQGDARKQGDSQPASCLVHGTSPFSGKPPVSIAIF
jgi:hypothetical protein